MEVHGKGPASAEAEFDAFVRDRTAGLLRTAYLLTRDGHRAEDLLQTALAKAWRSWDRIEGEPEPYVRKILVNTYASWWRRRWNGEQPLEILPEDVEPYDAERTDRQDLLAAMRRLTRRQQAVVVLRYFEDLTEAATADLLGCAIGTVKSQTSKALAKLRVDPGLRPSYERDQTQVPTREGDR